MVMSVTQPATDSYFWEGFMLKDPNVIMSGHLWQNEGVWTYTENQRFTDGRPPKTATPPVVCHNAVDIRQAVESDEQTTVSPGTERSNARPQISQAGSSFSCSANLLPSEAVICSDDGLASLDRQLAALYGSTLRKLPPDQQAALEAAERIWVAERNQCRTNKSCMGNAYQARISSLGGLASQMSNSQPQEPPAAPAENPSSLSTTTPSVTAQNPAPPEAPSTATDPTQNRAQWETLPVRIGAFHEAFNQIAQGGTTDLLAKPARCGSGACYYQLTDLDGSVASKVIIAAGPPENNASSIELQAPNTLAQNTLGAAVVTVVQIAAPQLSATARMHVMRSLFADMANPQPIGAGAACVDLVPGHWIISGYVFNYVVYIRIEWPASSTRGNAGKCRHLVPDDEVAAPNRNMPHKAQQTIDDCERDAACWVRHYPEVPSWCLQALFNRGELQALSVPEVNAVDRSPREMRWVDNQTWPVSPSMHAIRNARSRGGPATGAARLSGTL